MYCTRDCTRDVLKFKNGIVFFSRWRHGRVRPAGGRHGTGAGASAYSSYLHIYCRQVLPLAWSWQKAVHTFRIPANGTGLGTKVTGLKGVGFFAWICDFMRWEWQWIWKHVNVFSFITSLYIIKLLSTKSNFLLFSSTRFYPQYF